MNFKKSLLLGLVLAFSLVFAAHAGWVEPDGLMWAGLAGMTQMTTSQARVIDPILTTAAQGYKNGSFIGSALFPTVPVPQRGGKIITFGKEAFRAYATGRTPGSNTKRVQLGYAGSSYALESHSLEGLVPFELLEEANAVPGINLGNGAVQLVQDIIAARLEFAQATLATTAANYGASNKITLAGVDQWSDYSGTSDPVDDIEVAKEAIRLQIGRRPNTVVLGASVFAKLRQHPKIIDRIKYTGRDSATPELLANLFGVQRVLVGDAVQENDSGTIVDVWGKFVVVAYTEIGGLAEMGRPTFGYTYQLNGYPLVEQPYSDRNAKSWIYPVTDEVAPVIAGAAGGYLISGAIA